jgi:hypothetical protein
MSGYAGTGQATLLRQNQQVALFQQAANIVGRASVALQLETQRNSFPWGVSLQIYFTDANGNPADPGAFVVDVQASDLDTDAQYSTISAWPADGTLNASFVGRIELPGFYARYIRVFVASLANPAVCITVLATH